MRSKSWLLACLALAVVVLFSGCRGNGHWEDHPIGYRGEARRYPFLAATRMLDEVGYEMDAERVRSIMEMDGYFGTVVVRASSVTDESTANELRDLIADDVHVVLLLDGGEPYLNDWGSSHRQLVGAWDYEDYRDTPLARMVDEYGISVESSTTRSQHDVGVVWHGVRYELALDSGFALGYTTDDGEVELAAGQEVDELPVASITAGLGRLTVVTNAMIFRNRYLTESDHAALFFAVIDASEYDGLAIMEGGGITFFDMVWDRGWLLVVSGVVCLVFWLWRMMKRRASVVAAKPVTLTDFGDMIEGVGHFVWSQERGDLLVDGMKRAVVMRWASATGQAMVFPEMPEPAAVAERFEYRVPEHAISAAFSSNSSATRDQAQSSITTLQQIIRAL